MLSRSDFIFTIGYDGPVAVVDGQAKKNYGSLTTSELVKKGFFRAAYASALFSRDSKEMALVIDEYNKMSGTSYNPEDSLERLFGVLLVEVKRAVVL